MRGYVGVATDITERKEAESALQNLTRRLELATRAGKIGIWDFDLRRNHLVWDERMYDMYGIDPADFASVRVAWQQAVHPDDRERVEATSAAALRGERPYETEFRVVRPDGAIRHFKASALVLKDDHGISRTSDRRQLGHHREQTGGRGAHPLCAGGRGPLQSRAVRLSQPGCRRDHRPHQRYGAELAGLRARRDALAASS